MARIGDEVENIAHFAQLVGKMTDLLVCKSPGVPVPRGRQIVSQHHVRENVMNRSSPGSVILKIRVRRLPPKQIGEGGEGQASGDGHVAAAGN